MFKKKNTRCKHDKIKNVEIAENTSFFFFFCTICLRLNLNLADFINKIKHLEVNCSYLTRHDTSQISTFT